MSANAPHYVIRGGRQGRERLRMLARVMWPTTHRLLEPLVRPEARCLDVGCGGGDVTLELGRLAPQGSVVGVDVDDVKLDLARREAEAESVANVEFRLEDVLAPVSTPERFDVVYARFLLSHLPRPEQAVAHLAARLAPGGVMVVEDVDCSAQFCSPASAAFTRFVDLYRTAVRGRGADPDIGPRLPGMLRDAGLAAVDFGVVQPAAMEGDVKLLAPITFEAIASALVAQELVSIREVGRLRLELWDYARDPNTVSSIPRVVQAWARRST